uniref:Uncharacterized protein n=1 Tax=Arundo donax TaxID=35708 RepID=A0A0A9BT86_ARUDO
MIRRNRQFYTKQIL